MAVSDALLSFVREALAQGVARAEIEAVLLRAGWRQEEVRRALARFADVDFRLPVPRPEPYLSAREAFLYLLLFGTLFICALNLGTLLFQIIDLAFPAASGPSREGITDTMRWAVAALVVALPVFLYLFWYTAREVRRDPGQRASKIRRWLTYMTLFVAAGVIIGDLTALVYNLLSAGLTARFVLKVLTVGGIAGAVFVYYLRDLRREEQAPRVAAEGPPASA